MDYFISDTHFYGVRKFGMERFEDNAQRSNHLIKQWADRVKSQDRVFILGDFCDSPDIKDWKDLVYQLPGKLHLIRGNHEMNDMPEEAVELFEFVKDYGEIKTDGYDMVVLCHYPIVFYRSDCLDTVLHLHGHVHMTNEATSLYKACKAIKEDPPYMEKDPTYGHCWVYNVGSMCPWIDYTPRTISEIKAGQDLWVAKNII